MSITRYCFYDSEYLEDVLAIAVGKIIYTEKFKDVKINEKADEVYSFFLGHPIYKKMETVYGKIGNNPLYLQ